MTSDTVSSTARLSEQEAAVGFTASRQMAGALQAVLVDLIELHLQGKQAHWNLVGLNFRDLHKQLDHIVDDAREGGDTIAERMRSLRAVPDGRSDTVVATTTLPTFPEGELSVTAVVDLITTRLYATAATLRRVHDGVDAEDPSTADILHGIIETMEEHAWMVGSENRQV
ncbi:Dps family protein [Streptomyces sp. NBC_01497]|uniref:Dps family protein n=1 Tax=Streptomyces sp. NBC_01497 TaxID=2903885 RepID=UPI002E3260BA|nr:DNA starvation/stationary phase protection protein [Streptomyces sp. NBC_01497]